jgi:signal transduction histidine kinase
MAAAVFLLIAHVAPASEPAPDVAVKPSRTVLVLSSERVDLPSIPDFERGLREGLADPSGRTEIFVEYFDFGRFPTQRDAAAVLRYLRDRYAGRGLDVVVPLLDPAFEFVLAHRAELFGDTPIVAAGVEPRRPGQPALPRGVTTVPVVYDYDRTLALALALQPDAREVLVVHGTADFDLRRAAEARRSLEALAPRLRYRMLSAPLKDLEDAVRALPSTSAVLLVSMVRDAEGRALVGRDYAERFARVSAVPVYGTFASHMERGTLGGAITDYTAIGRATAAIVARTLAGELPPQAAPVDTPLRVNWRAVERWRIPVERIPPDARILFREPGLWERHRAFVLGAIAAVLLQALLITGLLLQSRRRRRAEASLRESEERLRLAADAANLGLWGWVPSHDHLWATARCRALHNLPEAGDISFRDFTEAVHPDDRDAMLSAVREALRLKQPFSTEYRVALPAGEARWIASQGRGTYDGSGALVNVLGVSVDVTARNELRRKQQELEHVTRVSTMGEIAASLAHELSQPLTAILSNAQAGLRFFDRGSPDPEEIRGILRDVIADDRRASDVISSLRSILRRGSTETQVFDVADCVREVLALLHSEIVQQQVEVECAFEGGFPVQANKTQIEQVLLNLLMNALEAMRTCPAGERRLWIAVTRAPDGAVRVAIRDSGVGIRPEDAPRVFEAFWTTKPSGMGMGLAVCSSIIRSCGGEIGIEPGQERGVTFFFTLPPAPVEAPEEPAAK